MTRCVQFLILLVGCSCLAGCANHAEPAAVGRSAFIAEFSFESLFDANQ